MYTTRHLPGITDRWHFLQDCVVYLVGARQKWNTKTTTCFVLTWQRQNYTHEHMMVTPINLHWTQAPTPTPITWSIRSFNFFTQSNLPQLLHFRVAYSSEVSQIDTSNHCYKRAAFLKVPADPVKTQSYEQLITSTLPQPLNNYTHSLFLVI